MMGTAAADELTFIWLIITAAIRQKGFKPMKQIRKTKQKIKTLNFKRLYLCNNFMAGAAGFEPANHGTKTRCLTTWLRPNNG